MISDAAAKEAKVFEKFLATKKVLIADSSAASRSGLFKVFHDLGAKTSNLILVNTFAHAQETIESQKPHVVVTEYDLGKKCGLELLQHQREFRPAETKDCVFVIVTSNNSQTAVARSAEEDVDAYIIKPFTPEVVRKTIIQAAVAKIRPSEYMQAIEQGKKAITDGKLDEAETVFGRATELDKTPSLAYYYLGQVKFVRQILDQAKGSYERGLEFNRIHYKCMVGLYDLLMKQQQPHQAYEVVKKISQYFPANPKRLAEVLRLAIVTSKFEDIEKYYNIFINIDERDELLIKYVCAALVVCGKYYLSTKVAHMRALDLFKKAAATAQGRSKILREIVLALLEYKLAKEAQTFLERFPPEEFNSDEFLLLRFLITSSSANGQNSLVVDQGRALIAKGIVDERLFTVVIQRIVAVRASTMAVEEIMNKAVTALPDKKAYFEDVLKNAQKASTGGGPKA